MTTTQAEGTTARRVADRLGTVLAVLVALLVTAVPVTWVAMLAIAALGGSISFVAALPLGLLAGALPFVIGAGLAES